MSKSGGVVSVLWSTLGISYKYKLYGRAGLLSKKASETVYELLSETLI